MAEMGEAILFAVVASSALPLGALITAVAFELFEKAFEHGGAWRAGVGLALPAGVTLDGVPENLAMGSPCSRAAW
jgi:ZIP family zinc transporter